MLWFRGGLLWERLVDATEHTSSHNTAPRTKLPQIMRNEVINDADVFQPIAMVATEICNEFTDETKEAVFLDDPFPYTHVHYLCTLGIDWLSTCSS